MLFYLEKISTYENLNLLFQDHKDLIDNQRMFSTENVKKVFSYLEKEKTYIQNIGNKNVVMGK